MSYHISKQHRAWNVGSIFAFVSLFLFGRGWGKKEALSVVKGKTDSCNVLDVLKSLLTSDKKYPIGEGSYTGQAIIEKVELFLLKHEKTMKKCPVVGDGRHRAMAVTIARAFGGDDFVIDPATVEISPEQLRTDAFEENVKHEYATKLSKIDKLKEVIGMIEAKEATKEADIQKLGLSRYQAQEFWAKAMLVRQHGMSVEDAAALKKEDARKASATADAEAFLAENAKEGKNAPKTVAGKVVRDMVNLLLEAGIDPENPVRALLEAIGNGDEVAVKDIVFQTIKAAKKG